ncbi:hypothetical protein JQ038_10290 [Clostridium botulinum]|nr:hypothetical protein [Clostridium botulinum]MCS4472329.1 hypothetical protein [Clostridium botulinum]MCS4474829.1 hypothetical protein [Clostridium botulinum]MCS4480649.1 hypothetical protein [Clostridium botulinum]MCS4482724.1 hypothetical protein [Clostridium botulinum]
MSNKERAEKTYLILKQRKRDRETKIKNDYMGHIIHNMDRVLKKNYGRKVKQI